MTALNPALALPTGSASIKEIMDADRDLYDPSPLPPNPMGPQIRSALHDRSIANMCNHQLMEIDGRNIETWSDSLYNNNDFPEAINGAPPKLTKTAHNSMQLIEYSPSRPQLGAANKTPT